MKIDTNSPSSQKIFKPLVNGLLVTEGSQTYDILTQPVEFIGHWSTGEGCATLRGYRNLPKNLRKSVRNRLKNLKSPEDVIIFNSKRDFLGA